MKKLYVFRCSDRGPEHLNQPECGNFYAETDYDGLVPYCPNCGKASRVRMMGEVELNDRA